MAVARSIIWRGLYEHAAQNLLRIAQEAVTNAVRHAQARSISVELTT